jgi:hypothetical protein
MAQRHDEQSHHRHHEQHEPTGFGSAPLRIGAIAVLLVLAVVAARARAEGALPNVPGPGGGLVIDVIRSIGIAVVTSGLVLLVWGRRVRKLQVVSGAPPKKQQLTAAQRKRVTVAALVGVVVALAYQLLMQSLNPTKQDPPPAPDQPVGPPDASGLGLRNIQSHEMPQAGLGTYLTAFAALVAVAALIVVVLRRNVSMVLEDEAEQTPAEAVAKAVAAGQAAVQDRAITDPRQAIVACFAAMERALAGLGGDIAPREADTPAEVLTRGVRGAAIPERPAETLLGLFREARFSEHPMHESDRAAADRALTEILASVSSTSPSTSASNSAGRAG